MNITVYQQRIAKIPEGKTEADAVADLREVGTYEFASIEEAFKVMKTKYPFRKAVGLGRFPVLDVLPEENPHLVVAK